MRPPIALDPAKRLLEEMQGVFHDLIHLRQQPFRRAPFNGRSYQFLTMGPRGFTRVFMGYCFVDLVKAPRWRNAPSGPFASRQLIRPL